MPRKRRKGYYVEGTFVARGSSLDAQLRSEIQDPNRPSRTARKHASRDLQDLGGQLLDLPPDVLDALALPDTLRDAIADAQGITSFGAKRRQIQFIGKLMRRLDDATLEAARAALRAAQ